MADDLNTLSGYDLFTFDYNWATTPSSTISIQRRVHAHEGTRMYLETLTDKNRLVFDVSILLDSESAVDSFLDFITDRKGIVNPFWIPHPFNILSFSSYPLASDTSLYFNYNMSESYFANNNRIYIKMVNGDILTHKVTDVSHVTSPGDPERTRIVINDSLDRDINLGDRPQIGILIFGRFSSDVFQLEYLRTQLAEVKLKFVELPQEIPS